MITYGELFAGYGGIHLGLSSVLGPGRVAWYSDNAPGPAMVMGHHHPGIPNLGDVTTVDWDDVEPVDVLTGGTPCQDLSRAGIRLGMRPGTRSGLWVSMAHAVERLRPRLVVWENVMGATSAGADCALEPCPGCLGVGPGVPVLRALGRVVGDLAAVGYDAWWIVVRASDVGGPHQRPRLFLFATPDSDRAGWGEHRGQIPVRPGPVRTQRVSGDPAGQLTLLVTPTSQLGNVTGGQDPEKRRAGGHGPTLADQAEHSTNWGEYGPAIQRWESVLGRSAPAPTIPGRNGPRLSPRFVEWMMGLPDGHVTDVPHLSTSRALQLLGNGVVPQQIAAAAHTWLTDLDAA